MSAALKASYMPSPREMYELSCVVSWALVIVGVSAIMAEAARAQLSFFILCVSFGGVEIGQ